jgi:cell division protein FtsA
LLCEKVRMAKKEIFTGVDLGSSHFRVVIGEETESGLPLRIIGVGSIPASGVRRGTVTNPEEAAKALLAAIERAEHMSGTRIETVTAALSGADMFCEASQGVVAIGRADGEVAADDVDRVLGEAHARATLSPNQEILHIFPRGFRLDDQKNLRDPIGLKGVRLEVNALVIGMGSMPSRNASRLFEIAKTNLDFVVASPLAAAQAVLSEKQKDLGVVLVVIGSGATSLAVFEEGELLHVAAIPIGGGHITNDIAIGLRTSIEVAEAVKLSYGHALPESID